VLALMTPWGPDPNEVVAQLTRRPTWQGGGACRGTDTARFFPSRGASTELAKAMCARYDVRTECLAHALADPELVGVWGGTSTRERQVLRRDARQTTSASGTMTGTTRN
jgi:WhiB family transcriptional regulator, redox-sensing transcriptional regulator